MSFHFIVYVQSSAIIISGTRAQTLKPPDNPPAIPSMKLTRDICMHYAGPERYLSLSLPRVSPHRPWECFVQPRRVNAYKKVRNRRAEIVIHPIHANATSAVRSLQASKDQQKDRSPHRDLDQSSQ